MAQPGGAITVSAAEMPNLIRIVPYDPMWPTAFDALSREVSQHLGSWLRAVYHVGSTAVPGLAAKPKIDMIAELVSTELLDSALSQIQVQQTFQFHGDPYGDGLWTFTRGHGSYGARLYVCGADNAVMVRWIRFRDRLRADVALAREYEALKRGLVTQADGDWRRYTGGKTAFVEAALAGEPPNS